MKRTSVPGALVLAALASASTASAQSNEIPGTDVKLGKMDTIQAMGREGVFPDGVNGVAMATTSCNEGTVKVPWEAAMLADHPMIAFLVGRETDGRLVQASDYSFVKHGFFALTGDFCDTCQEGPFGGGDVLGLGCSDTYSTNNNGDQYWLAPPQEIDPWLGEWDPVCSHFDTGEPAVAPPADCDGLRSLTTAQASALNPVGHRINLSDQELLTEGEWYYQGYYVIRGEPEENRANNWGTRHFTPSWGGFSWNLISTPGFQNGSILERWSGATVTSAKNGDDDGRLYVAVKVTGPVEGMYRYEYAVQNRDNFRGAGDVTIPICAGARVESFGFHDVDGPGANDWTATVSSTSIDVSVNGNPVRWNSFYNFWFDSDAAPVVGDLVVDQFDAGPGADSIAITTATPAALYNVYTGDGCSLGPEFPSLYANGPATLGSTRFELGSSGNAPAQPHVLAVGSTPGPVTLGPCTQWFGGTFGAGAFVLANTVTDGAGVAAYPTPIPNDPAFEGANVYAQAAGLNPSGGPIAGFDLTNGLRIRVGSALPDCP